MSRPSLPAIIIVGLLSGGLGACQGVPRQITDEPEDGADFSAEEQQLVEARKLKIGFTEEQVIDAWGEPALKREQSHPDGSLQIWTYTRVVAVTHYRMTRHYNEERKDWDYREEPVEVLKELVTRQATFRQGKLLEWSLNPAAMVFPGSGEVPTGVETVR